MASLNFSSKFFCYFFTDGQLGIENLLRFKTVNLRKEKRVIESYKVQESFVSRLRTFYGPKVLSNDV